MGLQFAKRNSLLKDEILDFYIPNPSCLPGICTGATELCIKYCYGNGVFRHSNNPDKRKLSTEVIALENYEITQSDTFIEQMCELIKEVSEKRKKNNRPLKYIRIHSIGDFYDYAYFLKWIEIINTNKDIDFIAYVKNFNVLKEYKETGEDVPKNFKVLLSFYPDTYDRYEKEGGKAYVDKLFEELIEYFHAKKYIVCSREFFLMEIKKKNTDKLFCNSGTKMLCFQYKLTKKEYGNSFVPGEGCDKCQKCYSDKRCPAGCSIYAVLRASGNLANINRFLKLKDNKYKYSELRKMYEQKEI